MKSFRLKKGNKNLRNRHKKAKNGAAVIGAFRATPTDTNATDILDNKRLKIARFSDFNDPFEFRMAFDSEITHESVLKDINDDDDVISWDSSD